MIVVNSQADLLKIIAATHAPRRLPRRLDGRQKQTNHDPDDGDYDQKFDQGKTASRKP
jgi:hypothetical protein